MADAGFSYVVFDNIPLERFAARDPCPPEEVSCDYLVELLASGCLTESQERELREIIVKATTEQLGRTREDVEFWLGANIAAWQKVWAEED